MSFQTNEWLTSIFLSGIFGAAAFYLAQVLQSWAVKNRMGNPITWTNQCGPAVEPKPTKGWWIYFVTSAIIMACILLFRGVGIQAAYVFVLLSLFLAISMMDIKYRIIPNGLVLGIIIIQIAWAFVPYLYGVIPELWMNLRASLLGMMLCFILFFGGTLITGGKVGMGDVKLSMAIGFMLGWQKALFAIAFSGIFMIPLVFTQPGMNLKASLKQMVPFGPPFSFAAMLVLTASFTPLAVYLQI